MEAWSPCSAPSPPRSISPCPDRSGSSTALPSPREHRSPRRAWRSPWTAPPSSRPRSSTPTAPGCTRCSPRVRTRPCATGPLSTGSADEPAVVDTDEIVYLRPSRYCESDTLACAHASPHEMGAWCTIVRNSARAAPYNSLIAVRIDTSLAGPLGGN